MKKVLAALVALCMLLTGMVVAVAEGADYTGDWYLSEMGVEGMVLNPVDLGVSIVLTLNEDGTATMDTGDGDVAEGTWAVEGDGLQLEIGGEAMPVAVEDGALVIAEDDYTMTFTREASMSFELSELIEAPVEDFAGSWEASMVEANGAYLGVSILGLETTATIEGTTITLTGMYGVFDDTAVELEYADGIMSFNGVVYEGGDEVSITAQMMADGSLSLSLASEEDGFSFIMLPVEAAEEAPAA